MFPIFKVKINSTKVVPNYGPLLRELFTGIDFKGITESFCRLAEEPQTVLLQQYEYPDL